MVLHEFGHALGLAHEHFHPDCQRDLRFSPDAGYTPTLNAAGEYMLDSRGLAPGALLWHQGAPSFWKPQNADFQLKAETYVAATRQRVSEALRIDTALEIPPAIDQRSVMLYAFSPILLRNGERSRCANRGDGRIGGARFATALSEGDIAYFRRYYDRPLPRSERDD